jgi:hypothetical protein
LALHCLSAGAHITALYLWQITILRENVIRGVGAWLGLYRLAADSPMSDLIPQASAAPLHPAQHAGSLLCSKVRMHQSSWSKKCLA